VLKITHSKPRLTLYGETNMRKSLVLIILCLLPFLKVDANEKNSYSMPRTQVIPIQESGSQRQYELYIKLPESYSKDTNKQYPVIYFTDAVWHIELLSAATAFIMEEVVLVGISWQKNIEEDLKQEYGAHFSRFGDYSYKKISNPKHPKIKFGQAKNHLAFIRKDVFRYVEENYRTDPNSRSYFGFSAGGNFGAYALMTQPDTFKNYILGSPSLWSDAPYLFAQENVELKSKELAINVFISYGELEKELTPHVEGFISKLKNKKYKGVSSIKHIVIESSGHSDSFPLMGVQSVKWLSGLQKKEDKSVSQDNIKILEGPYLGQRPPGLIPEPFAPGIVSTEHYEYGGTFTPDLQEFYFIRAGGKYEKSIFSVFNYKDNQWAEAIVSPRVGQAVISPDGKTMHLGTRYKERTETGDWSEIKRLSSPIGDMPIMRLTASSQGTYFFDEFKKDFTGSIRYSRLVGGKYEEPKLMSEKINSGKSFHPFIAPDESYLIFDGKREGGYGDSDIYISFRQQDGSWGTAINLGDKVNTSAWEAAASVTPDGKYLFFNRNMGTDKYENVDIFWVDAQIIETLRPN